MLLQKAKVVTTPTAYSEGFLHSVKPNVVLGNELVVNGTFDTDSDWTKGTGWTISGGKANCDGSQTSTSPLYQNAGLTIGAAYKVIVTISNYSAGNIRILMGGSTFGEWVNSNGEKTFILVQSFDQRIYVQADANFVGSIDNVSVKEKLDADFTFTRNSSATRVGEDGYIQDVQIIGGELVQNGDFEEIGSELVTNGSFDTDSDWSKGTGWTISGGVASHSGGTASYLSQAVLEASKTYRVLIKVVSADASNFVQIYMGGSPASATITSVGEYEYTFTSQSSVPLGFAIRGFGDVSIDNVSVKEVGQNWSFIGDFETDGTKAFITSASQYSQLTNQLGVNYLLSGRKYRLSFDIPTLSISNAFAYRYTGGSIVPISTSDIQNGRFTTDFVMPSNGYFWLQTTGSYTGLNVELDNVSVKEITDDTNLPRINYEGFDYDNGLPIYGSGKGHLLLEGQSTNIAYQGGGLTAVSASETSNFGISPSGENNSTKLESTVSSVSYVRTSGLSTLGTQACSIFVKKGIGDYIQLLQSGDGNHYANYDLVNGVVTAEGSTTTASIESYGDWLRLIAVFDSVSVGGGSFRCYLSDNPTAGFGGASSAVGNYIEYWGFQVEIGDYATSYIANTTPSTTVTRAAETCNNAGNADLFDSEGVLYADIAALANDLTQRQISIDAGGDTNNRIIIRYNDISNNINAYAYSGSVQGYFNYVADDITEFNKVAIRYKDNDFSFWVNGVQVATDTSGTAPTGLASLQFDFGGSFNFYGKTKMVAVFPYLSNDEMECLTTI
jgi:hypothetical protein